MVKKSLATFHRALRLEKSQGRRGCPPCPCFSSSGRIMLCLGKGVYHPSLNTESQHVQQTFSPLRKGAFKRKRLGEGGRKGGERKEMQTWLWLSNIYQMALQKLTVLVGFPLWSSKYTIKTILFPVFFLIYIFSTCLSGCTQVGGMIHHHSSPLHPPSPPHSSHCWGARWHLVDRTADSPSEKAKWAPEEQAGTFKITRADTSAGKTHLLGRKHHTLFRV